MKAIGTIQTTRLANSTNGNGRFRVVLVCRDSGAIVEGTTQSDSQFTVTMPRDGVALCTWHETPSGRTVFTDIRDATPQVKSSDLRSDDFNATGRVIVTTGRKGLACGFRVTRLNGRGAYAIAACGTFPFGRALIGLSEVRKALNGA